MADLGNNKYIVGFDNGYQFGKTANIMFDNGSNRKRAVGYRCKESRDNCSSRASIF